MSSSSLILSAMLVLCCQRVHAELTYECFPNNTLTVHNPAAYTNAFANNSQTICTATMMANNAYVNIEGCAKDLPILVTLHNSTIDVPAIIGGNGVHSSIISCLEIEIQGVTREFTHVFDPKVGHTQQTTVHPTFGITSRMYTDNTTSTIATNTEVGEPLFWLIEGFNMFDYKPVGCTAYKGTEVDPSVTNKYIIEEGCSKDKSLVQDFQFSSDGGMKIFVIMNAFRFYGSDHITIECNLRICPTGSAACVIDCAGRRKRSIDGHGIPADNQEVSVGDGYSNVVARLKVKSPRGLTFVYASGSSSIVTGSVWLIIFAYVISRII